MTTEAVERYIGDGVYASFDGNNIWLRTTREKGDETIAIEPEVWTQLKKFATHVWGLSA